MTDEEKIEAYIVPGAYGETREAALLWCSADEKDLFDSAALIQRDASGYCLRCGRFEIRKDPILCFWSGSYRDSVHISQPDADGWLHMIQHFKGTGEVPHGNGKDGSL